MYRINVDFSFISELTTVTTTTQAPLPSFIGESRHWETCISYFENVLQLKFGKDTLYGLQEIVDMTNKFFTPLKI